MLRIGAASRHARRVGRDAEVRDRERPQRRKASGSRPAHVLVVDDLEDNRELYSTYLELWGFEVGQAYDGVDALERIAVRPPDLVVMDLSMPRLDGWGATRLLKSDPRTRPIPVIVLTAHDSEDELRRARAAGADAVCTKPMLPQELLEQVEALLGVEARRA